MKYFIFSDVHSHLNELLKALEEAGYDENNKEHKLISCGDLFDRGKQSRELLLWVIEKIRNNKIVCIWGNHEDLISDILDKGFYTDVDLYNGTVKTLCDIKKVGKSKLQYLLGERKYHCPELKEYLHSCINSFTIGNRYICCHATSYDTITKKMNTFDNNQYWNNPYDFYQNYNIKDGFIVINGHFGTFIYRGYDSGLTEKEIFNQPLNKLDHSIYYGNGFIGLDATTAISKKVNVLVVEE